MPSEVQQARFERMFKAYDCDRDGFLTLENFVDHAYKLAALRGQSTDTPAFRALIADLEDSWKALAAAADTNGDGMVSSDEFHAWCEGLSAMLKKSVEDKQPWPLDGWIDKLYAMIDADGDGKITLAEYEQWCQALGILDEMDAEGAFLGFDKNLDGYLSREEFANVSRQFWLSSNPNVPGHRWLGP
jgi:Ca2+-binding EF-hand superfamily protein